MTLVYLQYLGQQNHTISWGVNFLTYHIWLRLSNYDTCLSKWTIIIEHVLFSGHYY